jgi:hypothetical protein
MPVNIVSGAKALIKVNEKVLGYATGISITETTFNGRVDSLGFVDTREITPIGRSVTAVVNMIRVFLPPDNDRFEGLNGDERDEAEMVNTASDTATGASERTDDALLRVPFSLEIYDTSPGVAADQIMYSLKGCRIASHNIVVDRGSLMGVQCTIEATHLIRHPGGPTA